MENPTLKRLRIAPFYRLVIALWLLLLSVIALPIMIIHTQPDQAVCLTGVDNIFYTQYIVDTQHGDLKTIVFHHPTEQGRGIMRLRHGIKIASVMVPYQQHMQIVVRTPREVPYIASTLTALWPDFMTSPIRLWWSMDERFILLINDNQLGVFDIANARYRDIPLSAIKLNHKRLDGNLSWSHTGHVLLHLVNIDETTTVVPSSDLIAYDVDTQTARTLAHHILDYRLSPDHTRLLITRKSSVNASFFDCFVVDLNTGAETLLLSNQGMLTYDDQGWIDNETLVLQLSNEIVWMNADGSQIKPYPITGRWFRRDQNAYWTVYTSDVETPTSSATRILFINNKTGASAVYTLDDYIAPAVSVSPDGKWVAFGGYNPTTHLYSAVRIISTETGRITVSAIANQVALTRSLVWSPDSQSVADIMVNDTNREMFIHVLRPDASEIKQLHFSTFYSTYYDVGVVNHWSNCAPYQ